MTVQLYHGDCLDVLKTLGAGSVDAVVTDPPYGIALENHDDGGARRKEDYCICLLYTYDAADDIH